MPITHSLWIKGTKGVRVSMQAWWVPSLSAGPPMHYTTLTGEWQRLVATETPADNYSEVSAGYVYLESGGEAVVVADKVEAGAEATPWPQDAMQAAADRKAAELLATERAVTRTDEFKSVYKPIEPCMAVAMNYRTGGVVGKLAIQKQTLTLDAGCVIKHTARRYER